MNEKGKRTMSGRKILEEGRSEERKIATREREREKIPLERCREIVRKMNRGLQKIKWKKEE